MLFFFYAALFVWIEYVCIHDAQYVIQSVGTSGSIFTATPFHRVAHKKVSTPRARPNSEVCCSRLHTPSSLLNWAATATRLVNLSADITCFPKVGGTFFCVQQPALEEQRSKCTTEWDRKGMKTALFLSTILVLNDVHVVESFTVRKAVCERRRWLPISIKYIWTYGRDFDDRFGTIFNFSKEIISAYRAWGGVTLQCREPCALVVT